MGKKINQPKEDIFSTFSLNVKREIVKDYVDFYGEVPWKSRDVVDYEITKKYLCKDGKPLDNDVALEWLVSDLSCEMTDDDRVEISVPSDPDARTIIEEYETTNLVKEVLKQPLEKVSRASIKQEIANKKNFKKLLLKTIKPNVLKKQTDLLPEWNSFIYKIDESISLLEKSLVLKK